MNTKSRFNTLELTKMGLLTALICVSAYIVIPLPFSPASLTAQTLVVNLIALLLTPRQAAFTIIVYIFLGLTGLPVFSGGVGGPGKLFGPTGGIYNGMAYSRCLNVAAERAALQFWAVLPCYRMHRDAGHLCPGKRLHEVRHRYGLDFYVYGGRPPLYPAGSV